MAIFMKIAGVTGGVQAEGYQGWIEVQNLHFAGITNTMQSVMGKTQNRITRAPQFGEIYIIKHTDKTSIALFEKAHSAAVIPEIEIHFVQTGDKPTPYEKYHLHDVLISHLSNEHNARFQKPREHLHLNYKKINRTFIERKSDGSSGSPLITGFDLEKCTKA